MSGPAVRTALVTGGTRGIGAAIARTLAEHGTRVIATYRHDTDTATAFAADVHGDVDVLPYDLEARPDDAGSAERLLSTLVDRDDTVDILVLSAAAPYPKVGLRELDPDVLMTKAGADVGAAHRLIPALAPPMLDRGFGRIVLIGSMHSLGPTAPGMAANGVAKAALASYLTYVVDELTSPGVTANLVEPGFVATDASAQLPDDMRSEIAAITPSARGGRPADVAGAVAWLAQDDAEFVNGVRVPVTGGLNHPLAIHRIFAAQKESDD